MARWASAAMLCALVLASPETTTEARQETATYASARFVIDHPNGCTQTTAFLEVFYYPGARPSDPPEERSSAELTYAVVGQPVGGGCDQLFYYDLAGTALLDAAEFSVLPNHKRASLDTTIRVFDGESDTSFDVAVTAEWRTTGASRRRGTVATLSVSAPQINPLYTINPLTPSSSAVIAQLPEPDTR